MIKARMVKVSVSADHTEETRVRMLLEDGEVVEVLTLRYDDGTSRQCDMRVVGHMSDESEFRRMMSMRGYR